MARATFCRSRNWSPAFGSLGFKRTPIAAACGTISCNSPRRLPSSWAEKALIPVAFPPGRLWLATSRRQRRPHHRTAEPRYELPPPHPQFLEAAMRIAYRGRGCMGTSSTERWRGAAPRGRRIVRWPVPAFVPVERSLRPGVWLFAPLRDKVTLIAPHHKTRIGCSQGLREYHAGAGACDPIHGPEVHSSVHTRYCPKDDLGDATPYLDFRFFAAGAGAAAATGGGST
jgi:hypothetical protein